MPSQNDRSSERTKAGGESPQEPLIDRRLQGFAKVGVTVSD
jgi:hypothetical protein